MEWRWYFCFCFSFLFSSQTNPSHYFSASLSHVYVPCCGRGHWGQDLGQKQDFKQPEPSEVPPWLFLGQTPTAGTGRNFKVAAKHLRSLVLVPWISQQRWVQVSLLLLSTHTGTCPTSARNYWPKPVQRIINYPEIEYPTSCWCEYVDQLLQQSKFTIKQCFELTHFCDSEAVIWGEYLWTGAQKLGLSWGQRRCLT